MSDNTKVIFYMPSDTWQNPRVKEWARGTITRIWTNNVNAARVDISTGFFGGNYVVNLNGPQCATIWDRYKQARASGTALDLTD